MVYDIFLLWSACNTMDPLSLVNRPRCEAAPFVGGSQGCDPLTRCVAPRHWRPSHLGPSVWAFLRQVGLDGKRDVSYRFKEENQAIYMFMYVYCYILYTLDICLFFCINIYTLHENFSMRHKHIGRYIYIYIIYIVVYHIRSLFHPTCRNITCMLCYLGAKYLVRSIMKVLRVCPKQIGVH